MSTDHHARTFREGVSTTAPWRADLDYFSVLGIPLVASWAEIDQRQLRARYHRAAKSAHPDAGGDSESMARISEAYRVLSTEALCRDWMAARRLSARDKNEQYIEAEDTSGGPRVRTGVLLGNLVVALAGGLFVADLLPREISGHVRDVLGYAAATGIWTMRHSYRARRIVWPISVAALFAGCLALGIASPIGSIAAFGVAITAAVADTHVARKLATTAPRRVPVTALGIAAAVLLALVGVGLAFGHSPSRKVAATPTSTPTPHVRATAAWVRLHPTVSPPAMAGGAMAYDPVLHGLVLFGGFSKQTGQFSGSTWLWRHTAWTRLAASGPPARSNGLLAYDSQLPGLLLFSGHRPETVVTDTTWILRSGHWTELTDDRAHSTIPYAALLYDPKLHAVLAFSAHSTPCTVQTTVTRLCLRHQPAQGQVLAFTGHGWKVVALSVATAPGLTDFFTSAITWDPHTGVVLAYGPLSRTSTRSDTTPDVLAALTGSSWHLTTYTVRPQPRSSPVLVYDGQLHEAVLYGGSGTASPLTDAWGFSAAGWTKLATDGPSVLAPAVAFDTATGQLVLFGGVSGRHDVSTTWAFVRMTHSHGQ